MDPISNNPGYPPVQQQQYPQNMMYANPAVVNNATLTLPQNSSIYTSPTNGMNMVDIVPAPYGATSAYFAPGGGEGMSGGPGATSAYFGVGGSGAPGDSGEQPAMMPHMFQPLPLFVPEHQPSSVEPIQPREKKILSFVDPNTLTAVNLPEKTTDVSTASSPLDGITKDAVPAEAEDVNSAFGRLVANRVVPVKNTANNQPQHEEEHHHVPAAAPAPTTAFTSTAPPFVPTSASYEPAVLSSFNAFAAPFNPASLKAQVAELVKDATPSSKEQSPAVDTPQKAEHSSTPEPAPSNDERRGGDLNPSWSNQQTANVRRPYYNRERNNSDARNFMRDNGNNNNPESVETRITKLKKDVQLLLNKITPTTYADLSREMINKCVWQDEETLPAVVELIFIKAVEEPTFVGLYSDLCSSLHKAEHNMEKENFRRLFHGAILQKCQSSFENTALSQHPESTSELHEQLKKEESKEENDIKKIVDLKKQLEDMKAKEKQQMIGVIKFTSHLFKLGLLNYKIIENCIVILIRNAEQSGSELMVEYSAVMMKYVGPFVAQRKEDTTKLDGYVAYLDKFKGTVSNRIKFMIMDLMELRDKKWIQQQK